MAQLVRRYLVPVTLVAAFMAAAVGIGAQQSGSTAAQTAAKPQTPPAPAPTLPVPPPAPPDRAAMTAAVALKDPDAKLAAFEKVRTDFPQSTILPQVDAQILSTLVANFPDRTADVTTVFDRILARIPADATPETRLNSTLGPVGTVVAKRLMLDRSEKLVNDAMAALNFEKYVQTQKDNAKRANRPEPSQQTLETNFNQLYKARGLEQLARIDMAMAEENLKAAIKSSPAFGTAQPALVELYMAKGDSAAAETVLKDSIKAATTPALASRPTMALFDFYTKKGDAVAAEATLKDALKGNPTLSTALIAMAKIEAKRGDNAAALDHYMTAAAGGSLAAADKTAMMDLHKKVHGSDACFDGDMDKIYNESYPNPVKPEPYKPAAPLAKNATQRLVLLEMFTGSGCPPCVSADLAFDAVMERYPNSLIVPVAYHQNIPQPDPMVMGVGDARRLYYDIHGVPTFNIDGALGELGGGARTNTGSNYTTYIGKIDKELTVPAQAAIALEATGNGDQINVTATVSKLPANQKDLKLHILLVEKELRFQGENGVRFHPMVVRAMAGDKGAGIPITANGKTKFTFDLGAIKDDVTATLKAEIEKRRKTETAGSTPREYAAEGHAYTTINPAELSVVAFVQQGPYVAVPDAPAGEALNVQSQTPTSAAAAAAAAQAGATGAQPAGRAGTPPAAGRAGGAGANKTAAPAKPVAPPKNAAGLTSNILQAASTPVVFGAPAKGKSGGQ